MSKLEFRDGVNEADIRAIAAAPRDVERAADVSPDRFFDVVLPRRTRGGIWYQDGKPVIAGGFTEVKQGVEYAWLVSTIDLKPVIRQIWPVCKRYVAASPGRVVTGMTNGQDAAIRLVRKLGFVDGAQTVENSRVYYLKQE